MSLDQILAACVFVAAWLALLYVVALSCAVVVMIAWSFVVFCARVAVRVAKEIVK